MHEFRSTWHGRYLSQLDETGRERVETIRHAPGLYDETLRLLAWRGLLDDH